MSEKTVRLGRTLRKLRTAQGLTLEQLSELAGVSKAMLSQIEQDKVNPTVAIMLKIARAMNIGVGELIDAPTPRNILRIIRHDDSSYTFRTDELCTIRTLSPLSLEKSIEFYGVSLEPKGQLESEAHFSGTEEFLHVAKGSLIVKAGGQETRLAKGDSIHYRADIPHCLQNAGKTRAEVYLIVRYQSE